MFGKTGTLAVGVILKTLSTDKIDKGREEKLFQIKTLGRLPGKTNLKFGVIKFWGEGAVKPVPYRKDA